MLLTNQKTINYKNLSKNSKETTPRFFDGTKILQTIAQLKAIYQL